MPAKFGFFDINNIFVTLWSYPLSYIELIGTVFGLIAVWLATRQKIISWPLGLINVSCFLMLFYQVQLYSGMFLQAFFFITNIYGWFIWRKQFADKELPTKLSSTKRWSLVILTAILTIIVGLIIQKLPIFYPETFPKPASQPYFDAFIAIASISGQIMLTRRISDNWFVWLLVNAVSVLVFFRQGLYLLTIEYVLFLLLALKGILDWKKSE